MIILNDLIGNSHPNAVTTKHSVAMKNRKDWDLKHMQINSTRSNFYKT